LNWHADKFITFGSRQTFGKREVIRGYRLVSMVVGISIWLCAESHNNRHHHEIQDTPLSSSCSQKSNNKSNDST